jgi:aminopeptidase N
LRDYKPPDYLIDSVDLDFDLGEEAVRVRSRLSIRRDASQSHSVPLVLDGEELVLQCLRLNGCILSTSEYCLEEKTLRIDEVPDSFVLEIETEIKPQENTALEGLYKSSDNFCTQCEAEGFRRITYFPDRPDVMARYTTTITANQEKYPVLLSNGNLITKGQLSDGRHWAKWEDPHKKPCYLFALVAGNLVCQQDFFVTRGGRTVTLQIFVEKMNADKCEHALRSLKKAMWWDEEVYGREYDLDIYMIVAVNDFNMGAMENKGLNVFNSKYVLAKPETATDWDYSAIERVIAHEYFHNWTGNRITCRDWFQLSLKEGLTVFREQCFSANMGSATVQRINDVRGLRDSQFAEDAGPMSHPVRPESYMAINNFYTSTVYYKGAEVVRMIHQILGAKGFRLGMDLYFERHDGQAVTTDDFVKAMEDANGTDLARFRNWYSQAGTPEVNAQTEFDASAKTYSLTFQQSCKATPNQSHKRPFHLPIALGLLDPEGYDFPLQLSGEDHPSPSSIRVLNLRQQQQSFRFVGIDRQPVPSLLRSFSAPVKLHFDYSDEELAFLMANDRDLFNRWEAGQRLAIKTMLDLVADYQQHKKLLLNQSFVAAFHEILTDAALDLSLLAEILSLPSESYLADDGGHRRDRHP